ncbi:hypothetical protein M2103_000005 [Ereboglobus sp. PH5-5]|uniref:IPT/TIG domain-containing protein n=1 Tax=Ereboglobus sp. PH5-5 TaxID=2940529 RepID=UPI0024072081|nr:IPT/TIG domain-containing protein [Ereboglobus sp. PH5-5]MDF9831801.1 hypothetical protein [Ereboglobus sp. PH5-5]
MQNNRTFHARSFFVIISALAVLVLAGCGTPSITNLTAPALPPNPSQIYTITARIKPQASNVVEGSTVAKIIIDGNAHKMTMIPDTPGIYEYEFQAPPGVTELRYYFLIEYQVSNIGILRSRTDYSPLQVATIVGRDAAGLSSNRGPAGSRIAITGRGFTSHDNVYFNDSLARSIYDSANSISFYVPDLPAEQNYTVSIGDVPGKLVIGTFRIDPGADSGAPATVIPNDPQPAATTAPAQTAQQGGALTVSPSEIKIRETQTLVLKFITPQVVQGAPMLIDVTTDIPESVIMPEVYVQPGSNVGSVTIKGGTPATGQLYAQMPGADKPLVIPVTIQPLN